MQLCPVCFWEDAAGKPPYNGSNDIELAQAQRRFLENNHPGCEFDEITRAPLPEEARSPHWRSFDSLRERTIALIESAFESVIREGGTTLHQMDLIDGNRPIKPEVMREAEAMDPESRWQDITSEKLSRFHESIALLNPRGLRFYLPAFMRHALRTAHPDIGRTGADGVIWRLDGGPDHYSLHDAIDLLDHDQMEAAAAFVQLIAAWGNSHQAEYGARGLNKGWSRYTPSFLSKVFE